MKTPLKIIAILGIMLVGGLISKAQSDNRFKTDYVQVEVGSDLYNCPNNGEIRETVEYVTSYCTYLPGVD